MSANERSWAAAQSPEARAKRSASLTGRPVSEETRAKLSLAARERAATDEGREQRIRAGIASFLARKTDGCD